MNESQWEAGIDTRYSEIRKAMRNAFQVEVDALCCLDEAEVTGRIREALQKVIEANSTLRKTVVELGSWLGQDPLEDLELSDISKLET
jgi:hypothetical protein